LYSNVSEARSHVSTKGVVLEVRVTVEKVANILVNPGLAPASTTPQEAPPWQKQGYNCAWDTVVLCVWEATHAQIMSRVDWRPDDVAFDRFLWFWKRDSTTDDTLSEMLPLSTYDSVMLESHFRAWDRGRGEGNICAEVSLRGNARCDWSHGTDTKLKGTSEVGTKSKTCSRLACWGVKDKAPSKCRNHKFELDGGELHYCGLSSKIWKIDFSQMQRTFLPRASFTTQELMAQSLQKAQKDG
jgi:hypothetical protein